MTREQFKSISPEALCLRWASLKEKTPKVYYMVRVPNLRNVKVGTSFVLRLADRVEQITTGRNYRIFNPIARLDDTWRNYILADYACAGPRYVAALIQALQEFGLLAVAQIFAADGKDGVMRRVVARLGIEEEGRPT